MSAILFIVMVTPLLGGPKDKPIIWRVGSNYHMVIDEVYWKEVFKDHGAKFMYENAMGVVYGNMDFVIARFVPEEKYRYATRTHSHLEFARKAHKFLSPKALFIGFYAEYYLLNGKGELGTLNTRITTPGGISVGVLSGILPVYPYLYVSTGASFVSEVWSLEKEISGAPKKGAAESTGFWGAVRAGLLYQIRAYFALDLSVSYNYLTLRHTRGIKIPKPEDKAKDAEVLQEIKVGIGLIFAMPWKVERTIY
jgi:hypothetical protein